jgi:hypothetical protein
VAQIEIAFDNPRLLFQLFETGTVSDDSKRDVPGVGVLRNLPTQHVETRDGIGASAPLILHVALELGRDLAVGIAANWLYARLSAAPTRYLRINRKQIELTEEGIARVITEEIERIDG